MIVEPSQRLVVVSNRLPIVLKREAEGNWSVKPGAGGLVTALQPVLRNRGGVWIGWPGTTEEVPELKRILGEAAGGAGYRFKPVLLTEEEQHNFYFGYANEIIWPLFHDLTTMCNFDPSYLQAGVSVNRKYAEKITEAARPNDFVWVHDYHLMLTAQALRAMGYGGKVAFFLHIPFPPLDIFLKLPQRKALLRGLLDYDMLGFQTARDRRNFIQCVRTLLKEAQVKTQGRLHTVKTPTREVRVGAFPIGIDFNEFAKHAQTSEVRQRAEQIYGQLGGGQIVLGVDRLDYTKGIPDRMNAFRLALRRHPELRGKLTLVQIVVPSRADIPRYAELKEEIERLVGEINGEFTSAEWTPIKYIHRNMPREELLAYYRAAETALVTPLKDGMNLVAKEFCAASTDENATLILSEFAGAAAQLHGGALLVNPHDLEAVAEAIYQAYTMDPGERRGRMRRMRRAVRTEDIFWWVDAFMRAAIERDLRDFPVMEEYIPGREMEEPGREAA